MTYSIDGVRVSLDDFIQNLLIIFNGELGLNEALAGQSANDVNYERRWVPYENTGYWETSALSLTPSLAWLGFETQDLQNASPDQQNRFDAAKEDMLKRLGANDGKNPCADLFGGYDKAIKALNDSKFSFVNPGAPLNANVTGRFFHAVTNGKDVYINSQGGFVAVNGQVPTQLSQLPNTDRPNERYFVTRAQVPDGIVEFRNDVRFASFIILHELGHRRAIFGKDNKDHIDDKNGTSLEKSARNNKKILDACFPP